MMGHDPRFIERIGEDRFRDAGHYYRIRTDGETAHDDLSQADLRLVVSIAKNTWGARPQHCCTWSSMATWASCAPWTSSTTAAATSSAPAPPGGSDRPSPEASQSRLAPYGYRCT